MGIQCLYQYELGGVDASRSLRQTGSRACRLYIHGSLRQPDLYKRRYDPLQYDERRNLLSFFPRHQPGGSVCPGKNKPHSPVFQDHAAYKRLYRNTNFYYLPICFATSSAKFSSFFSRPSPVSKRTKLLSSMLAPFSFAT